MALDVPTLTLVTVFVTMTLGSLLLASWSRDHSAAAMRWWGAAYIVGATGLSLAMMRQIIMPALSIDIANALVLLGYSFLLTGARAFNGRETPATSFIIAPLIWLTARQSALLADINVRIIIISVILDALVLMTAYEFWRARREKLSSRWPAIFILGAHAFALFIRIPIVIRNPLPPDLAGISTPIFAVMTFATLLFAITFAFCLLAMTKERGELRHKTASLIDPLTGLANRRAFLADAEELAVRRNAEPLSVLIADLDRFKAVNDQFGHAVGDQVLKVFAETISRTLRSADVSGRLGGEEFAIILPRAAGEAAATVAERIRLRFQEAALTIDEHAVASTVSIGIATTAAPGTQIADLLAVADRALYQAKAEGRNRVVCIDCDAVVQEDVSIVPKTASIVAFSVRRALPAA